MNDKNKILPNKPSISKSDIENNISEVWDKGDQKKSKKGYYISAGIFTSIFMTITFQLLINGPTKLSNTQAKFQQKSTSEILKNIKVEIVNQRPTNIPSTTKLRPHNIVHKENEQSSKTQEIQAFENSNERAPAQIYNSFDEAATPFEEDYRDSQESQNSYDDEDYQNSQYPTSEGFLESFSNEY